MPNAPAPSPPPPAAPPAVVAPRAPVTPSDNRRIRVFVSSTFRDMVEERDALMTHAWPELRRFCHERHVELVEVDLRWGIAEEQSTRKETLKFCLDEIHACRPFFVGLLGERYGWVPGDDAFTPDLKEEQPWLKGLPGKSVTELEILHGVLNNPAMAGRAFFYFRDPARSKGRGPDFASEDAAAAAKQIALKSVIRATSGGKAIALREGYPDPRRLADMVLEDLKVAIEAQFPKEGVPDPLTREARDHEAFAETRSRTYIGRPDYYEALDRHAAGDGGPLVLLGDSGSGKSALLANWIARWRRAHPQDFLFQHYIGGTPDSAEHWRLMSRLVAEIKRWSNDSEELPRSHEDVLKTFPIWLAKARAKAEKDGVRFVVVLDALNQLEDKDHARLLGWLPAHPFTGALRLIVSTLPGETLKAVEERGWTSLRVGRLTPDERRRVIADYLHRFGKMLDAHRVDRLAGAPAAANPLYLKILLDELRVTGTHDRLDERLTEYLAATDIPALLRMVLGRYARDYERDRKGLVSDTLGLIACARRGLTEAELLRLLRPEHLPQLPLATWTPLRAALEEGLVDRGGVLNFAHDFLRTAAEAAFVQDEERRRTLRLRLADDFESQPVSARGCDELPWLLSLTGSRDRLRACLLDIDRFLLIRERDQEELMRYWVGLGEERAMGKFYLESFERWGGIAGREAARISFAGGSLAFFLDAAALHGNAEPLMRRVLAIKEQSFGKDHPGVAICLSNLAMLLQATNRLAEAEPLMRRALAIDEQSFGKDHPTVAIRLNNLAQLLQATNRLAEAEPLMRRALAMDEQSFGEDHPRVAICLSNLAMLLDATNRLAEAEPLMRRALATNEQSFGKDHPGVARDLNNLAQLLQAANRLAEAEPLMRRALAINEQSFGKDHPKVATDLDNLAGLLQATNRLGEAEPLMRRALAIFEQSFGKDHPGVAGNINNLAGLLQATNRLAEAEPLMRRALIITEQSFGKDHPKVATVLSNLTSLLQDTNRLAEAEPLMRRALAINEQSFGKDHPDVATALNNLALLLKATNRLPDAEPLMRRALAIHAQSFGRDHPNVAIGLNNLALLLQATNRLAEAEPMMRRALAINEQSFGKDHPRVATGLNNLAVLLLATNRHAEAEPMMRRALAINEQSFGKDHPEVARVLYNLVSLLKAANRLAEAEPMMRRALASDEQSFGKDHPTVAIRLNNLASLLKATNRLAEAEPIMRRMVEIFLNLTKATGHPHPHLQTAIGNYTALLQAMGRTPAQVLAQVNSICEPYGIRPGGGA